MRACIKKILFVSSAAVSALLFIIFFWISATPADSFYISVANISKEGDFSLSMNIEVTLFSSISRSTEFEILGTRKKEGSQQNILFDIIEIFPWEKIPDEFSYESDRGDIRFEFDKDLHNFLTEGFEKEISIRTSEKFLGLEDIRYGEEVFKNHSLWKFGNVEQKSYSLESPPNGSDVEISFAREVEDGIFLFEINDRIRVGRLYIDRIPLSIYQIFSADMYVDKKTGIPTFLEFETTPDSIIPGVENIVEIRGETSESAKVLLKDSIQKSRWLIYTKEYSHVFGIIFLISFLLHMVFLTRKKRN